MDLRERRPGSRRHPWEIARARCVARLLADGPVAPRPALLDVGCGDGYAARTLGAALGARRLVGVDPALPREERRSLEATWPPMEVRSRLGEVEGTFDVVLLLDVLEHVPDDRALLANAASHLAQGGVLLATAPAFPALFSAHDRMLAHLRRYRRARLVEVATGAALTVEASGYLFATGLPARLAAKALERMAPAWAPGARGVGAWRGGPRLTAAIAAALDADTRLLEAARRAGVVLPGLTAWMRCRPDPDAA